MNGEHMMLTIYNKDYILEVGDYPLHWNQWHEQGHIRNIPLSKVEEMFNKSKIILENEGRRWDIIIRTKEESLDLVIYWLPKNILEVFTNNTNKKVIEKYLSMIFNKRIKFYKWDHYDQ